MAIEKPIPLIKETYLAVIRNSVGSRAYCQFFAHYQGVDQDIVQGDNLSCGFFASTVLHMFHCINELHLTVNGTVKDLEQSGWQRVTGDHEPGDVLVWESQNFDNEPHRHIGFFIGDGKAISTDSHHGVVSEHPADFDGNRKIEQIYRFDFSQSWYKGILVEESLEDKSIINNLNIIGVEISQKLDWHMYTVRVTQHEIKQLSKIIKPKWYMHFWHEDKVIAIFRDKQFMFHHNDKSTWLDAVEYGKLQGIPEDQLDFPIN